MMWVRPDKLTATQLNRHSPLERKQMRAEMEARQTLSCGI
jgi:hypothetical protein